VSALKTGEVGVLRAGATPQVIENLLATFLSRYRRRHAGVEVRMVEDGGSRLPGRLERGDVDVALMPAGHERFSARLLYPMYVLAVMPPGHRLSRHEIVEVTELANEPLLRLSSRFASHGWFEAACHLAHIQPRVLLESVAPQTLIALARTGHGVAVVPSPVRIPRSGVRVAVLVHRGASIGRWAVAAWDSQRFWAPYAAQFVEELVVHCRDGYPGHEYAKRAPRLPRPKLTAGQFASVERPSPVPSPAGFV
jgi:DNA-binding transcriptional LysR family regulator